MYQKLLQENRDHLPEPFQVQNTTFSIRGDTRRGAQDGTQCGTWCGTSCGTSCDDSCKVPSMGAD